MARHRHDEDTLSIQLAKDSLFTALFETDPNWQLPTYPTIFINEVMASNTSAHLDNYGETADWIELYNPTASVIDLAGYSITDDSKLQPSMFLLPATQPKFLRMDFSFCMPTMNWKKASGTCPLNWMRWRPGDFIFTRCTHYS
jgi:hypothetical protein